MRTCRHCEISIEGKRANAVYCSKSCRVMATRARKRAAALPVEMTGVSRWVAWKPFRRKTGWSKMPIQIDGRAASSTDPATWTDYASVKGMKRKGFVVGNGIGCIDLDGCIVDGVVADWALAVIDEYRSRAVLVEVSPSGTGVHIFTPMEPGKGRVIRDGRNIEVYPPDSGRFICVTGSRI